MALLTSDQFLGFLKAFLLITLSLLAHSGFI